MNYALILILASNVQSVGVYADQQSCQKAARELHAQNVKAACVQQETPEQAIAKMQLIMKSMLDSMPK